jgi:hypothetical protein
MISSRNKPWLRILRILSIRPRVRMSKRKPPQKKIAGA